MWIERLGWEVPTNFTGASAKLLVKGKSRQTLNAEYKGLQFSMMENNGVSLVSIIVPCFNEEATISSLLEAIYTQTYPRQQVEVIISDGLSTDNTRKEIALFQSTHSDIRIKVIDNQLRIIPAGINCAIAEAQGKFIIRLDAHSKPYHDYIEQCVEALQAEKGDNVGGVWDIQPGSTGWQARAIAAAASHPLGAGDARYRVGGEPQWVDTVPFGAFRRELLARVGKFDETLLSNEDYEFNVRIRANGGKIWLDPKIKTIYYARSSFGTLAQQYWRYGFWKARMLMRYPHTFRWRQLAGLFVLSFAILGLLSLWFQFALWLFMIEISIYCLVLTATGTWMAFNKRDLGLLLGFPWATAIMHFAWGTAFLWGLTSSLISKR